MWALMVDMVLVGQVNEMKVFLLALCLLMEIIIKVEV